MKKYFMRDAWNVDRMEINARTDAEAENAFRDQFGYFPDVVKVIDDLGGTLYTIRGKNL